MVQFIEATYYMLPEEPYENTVIKIFHFKNWSNLTQTYSFFGLTAFEYI